MLHVPQPKTRRTPHCRPKAIVAAFTRQTVVRLAISLVFALAPAVQAQTPSSSPSPSPSSPSAQAAVPTGVANHVHANLRGVLPQHKLAGKARLTVWGFDVYDASLWVTPSFKIDQPMAGAFALELAYLREFTSADIAKRSIVEMRRLAAISDAQADAWHAAMLRVLPHVKKGDRVMGIYQPGTSAAFMLNGQPTGEVADAEFARLFFGIWLSPNTSEPQLRRALLAGAL